MQTNETKAMSLNSVIDFIIHIFKMSKIMLMNEYIKMFVTKFEKIYLIHSKHVPTAMKWTLSS